MVHRRHLVGSFLARATSSFFNAHMQLLLNVSEIQAVDVLGQRLPEGRIPGRQSGGPGRARTSLGQRNDGVGHAPGQAAVPARPPSGGPVRTSCPAALRPRPLSLGTPAQLSSCCHGNSPGRGWYVLP